MYNINEKRAMLADVRAGASEATYEAIPENLSEVASLLEGVFRRMGRKQTTGNETERTDDGND